MMMMSTSQFSIISKMPRSTGDRFDDCSHAEKLQSELWGNSTLQLSKQSYCMGPNPWPLPSPNSISSKHFITTVPVNCWNPRWSTGVTKWMASSNLMNWTMQQVEQLARASNKTIRQQTRQAAKWNKWSKACLVVRRLGLKIVWMQMLWVKDEVKLKLKLGPRFDWAIQILVTW